LIDGLLLLAIDAAFFLPAVVFDEMGADVPAGIFGVLGVLSFIFGGPVYETILIGRSGQTIGKRLLSIKVVRTRAGDKISYGPAFGRAAVVFVSGAIVPLVALVVFAWALWDPRNQGLHDKAADTIVIWKR
jgi:uncharacterized RDD family membrane protein YckC